MLETAGLVLLGWTARLAAPQEEAGSATLRREGDFARALTVELGFDNLAEAVLDRALARADSGEDRGVLLLARCDIRKEAARRAFETPVRIAALAGAGQAYSEFLRSDPPPDLASAARVSLAEVAYQYGLNLKLAIDSGLIGTDSQAGELKLAEGLFESALQAINTTIELWSGLADPEEKDSTRFTVYFPSCFYRSLIFFYWGLLYPAGGLERREYSRKALESLEKFTLEVGETSIAGLKGYIAIGDVYAAQGDIPTAESFYRHVIENGIPPELDPGVLTPIEIDGRRDAIQQAYLGLANAFLGAGRVQEVIQLGETFQAWERDAGIVPRDAGYRTLLRYAEALTLQGGYDQAIAVAQRVIRENERSVLRFEANEVVRRAIRGAPADATIDIGVLMEAAMGAYNQRSYGEAIEGFQTVLARAGSSSKAQAFAAQAHFYLGRSWSQLDRKLEAVVTYQRGYELFPDDEEYGARNAQAWHALAEALYAGARDDKVLADFLRAARQALQESGTTPDVVLWQAAQNDLQVARDLARKAADADPSSAEAKAALAAFDRAAASYRQIQRGARWYEKSVVEQGMCEYYKMPWDPDAGNRALQVFSAYLDVFVQNPENNPADAIGRKNRNEAVAKAEFYRAQVCFRQGQAGDAEALRSFVRLSEGYSERHPEQEDYSGGSHLGRIQAFLILGQADRAVLEYDALAARDLDRKWVRAGAYRLYEHYQRLLDAEQDVERQRIWARLAADYLGRSNAAEEDPDWKNLYAEAMLRQRLGESSTAASLLERILEREGARLQPGDRFQVDMALVNAYLAQDKTGAAAPIVEALLQDPVRQKDAGVLQAFVRIRSGFPVMREGRVVEVPGVGDPKDSYPKAEETIADLANRAEYKAREQQVSKWELRDFWEVKLMHAYLFYRWSQVEPGRSGAHRTLIASLRSSAPDLGGSVMGDEFRKLLEWLEAQ